MELIEGVLKTDAKRYITGSVVGGVGRGLEDVDVVAVVDRGHGHWLERMEVHLVDLLEMARVHETLLSLREVPQRNAVGAYTPQAVLLFVAPLHLGYVTILAVLGQVLREITDVPNLD